MDPSLEATHSSGWEALAQTAADSGLSWPKLTICIPIHMYTRAVGLSLKSLLAQDYHDLEVLVIDSGSSERTIELIKSFSDPRISLSSVTGQEAEMLNKVVSLASGRYINFLFPGYYYIARDTLKLAMSLALKNQDPDLIYGASLLRDGKSEPQVLFRPLSLRELKKGCPPTSLPSCWFRLNTLRSLGKFSSQGDLDLFCRFAFQKELRVVSTHRVLTDNDLPRKTKTPFWETFRTIKKYFGFFTAIRWILRGNPFRITSCNSS